MRARDDNSGDGDGDSARLTGLFLAPGKYTIEATTGEAGDRGPYRLSIGADFAVQAPEQPERIDARVGQTVTRTWGYLPAGATASVQSVTPSGLGASVLSDDGWAALAATATHAGDYTVTVAYTASGHTSTIETNVKILCPPAHVKTPTRTCTHNTATLPADCAPAALHDGPIWGRRQVSGKYRQYGDDAPAACISLTHDGRAAYYSFTLPRLLPVRLELADADGMPLGLMAYGGTPSMTLWRVASFDPAAGTSVHFAGTSSSGQVAVPVLERKLTAGAYLVELAPSAKIAAQGRYALTAAVPTATRAHADVQHVGNTGLGDDGMALGQFLDARGSLIYGAHPDADPARAADPFYPESPDYPWLAFSTDRCSIPPAWILHLAEDAIDEIAIRRLGPLGWLAARFLPDAGEIQDHPQFGGVTVPFVYGCMRHDFNWRNLHRIKHHYQHDTAVGTWNSTVREDADNRLGADLATLCRANQGDAPEGSIHFTWELPNQTALDRVRHKITCVM